uniref:Uncharacterized protein n=1 Tax=Zea mays TaxID=4577 RepID=B6SRL6_MAIZE|nr:hypothetical protein [Zea mays]
MISALFVEGDLGSFIVSYHFLVLSSDHIFEDSQNIR